MVHISSLVVQVTPQGRAALLSQGLPCGARLHPVSAPSKLIVTLEAGDEQAAAETANVLLQIPGVLTVAIVTHFAEHLADTYSELT